MRLFHVTVRIRDSVSRYSASAHSWHEAYMNAAEAQGDEPCGITVTLAGNQS